MEKDSKPFEVEKTFGLGVLLKLTKKNVAGIEIATHGNKFKANVTLNELNRAVDTTLKTHNIRLKLQ